MEKKLNLLTWLSTLLKEFVVEAASKPQYEIVELYECPKTGFIKAIIKLGSRHTIEKNISAIVIDNRFIEGLDKKSIRTLTYMATVERMKPDYSVVIQHLGEEVDEYLLEIRSKKYGATEKKSPSDILKNKSLLEKFSPVDANRIGYLAGIMDAAKEFQLKRTDNNK